MDKQRQFTIDEASIDDLPMCGCEFPSCVCDREVRKDGAVCIKCRNGYHPVFVPQT